MSTSLLHGLSTMKSCPKLLDCCRNMVLSKQLDGILTNYALPKVGGSSSNTQCSLRGHVLYYAPDQNSPFGTQPHLLFLTYQ
jgi:hypothetical protein